MNTPTDSDRHRSPGSRTKLLVAAVSGLLAGGLALSQAHADTSDPVRDSAARHGCGSKDGCSSKDKDKDGCSSKDGCPSKDGDDDKDENGCGSKD